jgi:hypothetical protein
MCTQQLPEGVKVKKIIALLGALLIALTLSTTVANAASKTEKCNPKAAYTEVIKHPAVTHVVHTDAVPATDEVWANWSPNDTKGPQDYTPVWPEDERGTWHVHNKIPNGHEGPDGVYQRDKNGNGNSDWFYRHAGTNDVPASDVTVVDQLATTEVITHEAVKCDEKPVTHSTTTFEPAPVPTVKPKHVVIPTLVHAGL